MYFIHYFAGPGVNKARLYEEQQRKVEELGTLSLSDGKLKAPETDRFDEHDEVILKAPEEGDYENTAMEIDEEEMRVEKNHNETNEAMELAEEDIEKEVSMDHRSDQDNEDAISVNSNTQL